MRRSVLVILLAGLAVPCTPALAATVHLNERTGFLVYRAAPGERNHVRITVGREVTYGGHDFAHYSVEDSARVQAGTGCRRAYPGRRHLFTCDMDIFGAVRAVVRLGDRSDLARILGDFDSARVEAGGGDDVVRGGPEVDVLLGGPGTDALYGGAGVDRLFAGSAAGGAWPGRRTVCAEAPRATSWPEARART